MLTYFPPPISAARWSNSGLLGLRGFSGATYTTNMLDKPAGRVVPLSSSMTYQQRLDYARGGFWAMVPFDGAGLPADVIQRVRYAIEAYFTAAAVISQNRDAHVQDQLNLLSTADGYASSAIAYYRDVLTDPLKSAAPASAVAKLPPAGEPITAASLHAAQAGFFGSLSSPVKVGLVVGGIWLGKKLIGL